MQKNYLKKPAMVFLFYFTKNVFLSKVFAQICCYLSKFQDILRNFFPRETFRLWLLTVVRFSKYLFKQKLYIQGRTLKGLRKSMTFSISSGSLVAIQQTLQFTFRAAEAYSEPFQMSKMELFVKKINGFQLLASLAKSFISNVYRDLNTLPSS